MSLPRFWRAFAALAFILAFHTTIGASGAAAEPFAVSEQRIVDLKAVFGTVESVDQVPARTRISGTIQDVAIDEGASVEAGDVLANVGDDKLALTKAALDSRIEAAQSEFGLAEVEAARIERLRRSGTVSQAALDAARTKLEVARGTLASLQAERAVVAEQEVEGAVLAPVSGRVLKVYVRDGQVVQPGETIADIAAEDYVLRIAVPERHARTLAAGDKVLVGEAALGAASDHEQLTEGKIEQVYPRIENGRVIADVRVKGLGDYFVGERVRAYVGAGERSAIVIPETYLFERFGLTFVRLENGEDVVVQTGERAADGIEILSGLSGGDVLVMP